MNRKRRMAGTLHSHVGAPNPKACSTAEQSSTGRVGRQGIHMKQVHFIYFSPGGVFTLGNFTKLSI